MTGKLYKYLWFPFILLGFLAANESDSWKTHKIVELTGVYDINANGRAEYFVVLENGIAYGSPLIIRHVEIGGDGYQQTLWELSLPEDVYGDYIGLKLADLAGDNVPELVILMNISELDQDGARKPILYVFQFEDDSFGEFPVSSLDLSDSLGYLLSNNIQCLDRNGDNDDELVITLGSPRRSIILIDQMENNELAVISELTPESLNSGSGFIYTAVIDHDHNGYDDLIAFSPVGDILIIQPYYNNSGSLEAAEPVQQKISGLHGLLPRSITVSDWDADGFDDIILPFQSGHVIAMTMTSVGVPVAELPIEAGPLSDIRVADFNQDDYLDLLLVSAEMNMLSIFYGNATPQQEVVEYFSLAGDDGSQVFQVLPVVSCGLYTGMVIAASWNGLITDVFTSDLGTDQAPLPAEESELDTTAGFLAEDILAVFPVIETTPESLFIEELPVVTLPAGRDLPVGVLPRHVLRASQSFIYTIPEDEMRYFYSFRWLKPPPKGMFFHYESRSITWIPSPDQLGAYQMVYQVEMKIGEKIDFDSREPDSLMTYQVVPDLDGYEERLWIYVNDPPQIISEPSGVDFVADELFTYQPQAVDANADARITFTLEQKPTGMTIDQDGLIQWQTDSTHVKVYPVRLVASDGFERSVQEFTVHPRAGVSIISRPDSVGQVNEDYRYKIEVWKPEIDLALKYSLLNGPEGMTIDSEGILNWTPSPAQIDSASFTFFVTHGVARDTQKAVIFVNHPPIIESAPTGIITVRLGETYDAQILARDPNSGDQLQYSALLLPEGMRMDPYNGRLLWEPTEADVDFSHLLVAVSDGRETRMVEAEFFVNAPLTIISLPPMQAEVGLPYQYKLKTADLNKGNLLTFDKLTMVDDISKVRIYGVKIADDIYKANIRRYIGDWDNAPAVYAGSTDAREDNSVSRLNLKKYVHSIFYESDQLIVILQTIDQRTVSIKDVLWEFFQGSKGKPPRVSVDRIPTNRYSLLEFPDGMEVDELTGTIHWTPALEQIDVQRIRVLASDGYLRDEQVFDIYVNQPPLIVSKPGGTALVSELFKYQIIAEDKNSDAELKYSLLKAPTGMQMSRSGRVVWKPKPSQINNHKFTVQVSDGYKEDSQNNSVYVNINPTVLSTPKPVALTGYEYRYKMMVEDLNKDRISFRPLRLPKYAKFNPKTGLLVWKPRSGQKGPNDVIIMVTDERGAATSHEFQIHVFEDPSDRQFVNTGWPLLLTFVGVMFAWGAAQI